MHELRRHMRSNRECTPWMVQGVLLFFCVWLFLSLSSCSSIVKLPAKSSNDYHEDRPDFGQTKVKFIELDTSLKQLENYNSVYLFATWCPHCYVFLSDFDEEGRDSIALVSTNYNVSIIDKQFSDNIDTVYLLSNQYYGGMEDKKIQIFQQKVTGRFDGTVGVPQVFQKLGKQFKRTDLNSLKN